MYSNNYCMFCIHAKNIKRTQFFSFLLSLIMSRCTKSMQKIASLYILVHIYIVRTAFHRDVPCFCCCVSDRRVSTFREMHETTRDGHPETQRQQAPSRHTSGESQEKHSIDPIGPDFILFTNSLSHSPSLWK